MNEQSNIAWKPILFCVGAFLVGGLIGTFLTGPALQKARDKKALAEQEDE